MVAVERCRPAVLQGVALRMDLLRERRERAGKVRTSMGAEESASPATGCLPMSLRAVYTVEVWVYISRRSYWATDSVHMTEVDARADVRQQLLDFPNNHFRIVRYRTRTTIEEFRPKTVTHDTRRPQGSA